MSDIAVLLPFGGTDPYRLAALEWVSNRYDDQGWPSFTGHCHGPEWRKGEATADAFAKTNAEILIVADADVWADDIVEAVEAVLDTGTWAMPHKQVRRLAPRPTVDVLAGEPPNTTMPLERGAYRGVVGGGIVVLHRDIYERAPLDVRFDGWGGEDLAWGYALATVAGRRYRCRGPLWHLWHPTARPDERPYGSPANSALCARYRAAADDLDAMHALIAEGHAWASNGSTSTRQPS